MATPAQNKEYYAKNKDKIKENRKAAKQGQEASFYVYALILFASLLVTITRSAAFHSGEGVPWPVLSSVLLEVSFIAVLLHQGWWPKLLGTVIGVYIAATLIIPSFNKFQSEYSNNSETMALKSEILELKAYQAGLKKYSYKYNLARNDIKSKQAQLKELNQTDSEKIQAQKPSSYLNSASRVVFYLLMLFNSVFFSRKVAQCLGASQRAKTQPRVMAALQKLRIKWQAAKQAWIQI